MPDQTPKPSTTPAAVPKTMPGRFDTQYDQNRDPFYGEEFNPYRRKRDDAR